MEKTIALRGEAGPHPQDRSTKRMTSRGAGPKMAEQRLAETEESDASVDILAELAETYTAGVIDEALSVAREHLDMEVAYVSRFEGDRQVFRAVDGDPKRFGSNKVEASSWMGPIANGWPTEPCRTSFPTPGEIPSPSDLRSPLSKSDERTGRRGRARFGKRHAVLSLRGGRAPRGVAERRRPSRLWKLAQSRTDPARRRRAVLPRAPAGPACWTARERELRVTCGSSPRERFVRSARDPSRKPR